MYVYSPNTILNPWLVGGLLEIHCRTGLLATRSNGQKCLLGCPWNLVTT